MDFESLPLEIKSHIFSYLSIDDLRLKVAIVSKKWQELSRDPYIVEHIEINNQFDSKEIIQRLVTFNQVRSLKITTIFDFNWVFDIPVNNNLRRLHIHHCNFEIETLQVLSTRFPMISKLKFVFCCYSTSDFFSGSKISSDCARLFAENCQRLEDVDIGTYSDIDETSCQTLLNLHDKTLTKLKLSDTMLTDKNFTTLTQCSRITDLRLHWLNGMTDSQLLRIKKLRSLRKLSITGANSVSTNAFAEFFTAPSFSHLYSINLSYCDQLSNDVITLISKSYPDLKSLNIFSCRKITDAGVKSILENCSVLKNLNLSILCTVDEYFLMLTSTFRMSRLKYLNIVGRILFGAEFYRQRLKRSNPGRCLIGTYDFVAIF